MNQQTIERIFSRISFDHDCWRWNGSHDQNGYGRVVVHSGGSSTPVHRVVYEAMIGSIPVGREMDHLCRNRGCCNPMHLEPVTHRTNMRRGLAGAVGRAQTHCHRGHAYEEHARVSVEIDTDGTEHKTRVCRLCSCAESAKYRARRKVEGTWPKKERTLPTHCRAGHEFTPENTYLWWNEKKAKHHRYCRICLRAFDLAKKERKRALGKAA